jgi:hypothetical protein
MGTLAYQYATRGRSAGQLAHGRAPDGRAPVLTNDESFVWPSGSSASSTSLYAFAAARRCTPTNPGNGMSEVAHEADISRHDKIDASDAVDGAHSEASE